MKSKVIKAVVIVLIVAVLSVAISAIWLFLRIFVLPIQENFEQWSSHIEAIEWGEDIEVLDSVYGKTVGGAFMGNNDYATYSYYMIIRSSLPQREILWKAESSIAKLNNNSKGDWGFRVTQCILDPLSRNSVFRGDEFNQMLQEALQNYGDDEDVYLLAFDRFGKNEFFY